MTFLCLVTLVVAVAGNEWFTSRHQHCIERCTAREKKGKEVYACYTVDGLNKEFRPSNQTASSRPGINDPIPSLDDDDFPWDYCTPAKSVSLEQDDPANSETIAKPVNNTQSQGGFNPGNRNDGGQGGQGGQGFNPGALATGTSIPGILCNSPCKMTNDKSYKCTYDGSNQEFYCSPDYPLERKQITSHNKLWCTGPCEPSPNNSGDMCRTLMGKDLCSRTPKFSSKGTACLSECAVWPEAQTNHLTCRISNNNSTFEACGNWDFDSTKTAALEYTHEGKVCASPCTDHDDEMLCSYVEWKADGNQDNKKSILYMMEGECGPEGDMNWTMIGIILGCVVGAIILIALVGAVVSKRSGYNRAATNAS